MKLRFYSSLGFNYQRGSRSNGIHGFRGAYRFLSNFYVHEPFMMNGLEFDSSERAYMWHKSQDIVYRKQIMLTPTPTDCKTLGATVKLRPNWNALRIPFMYKVLRHKYRLARLRNLLLSTDFAYLEETNIWNDTFWGRCHNRGHNHLGRILMVLRYQTQQGVL